jgi:hypothetical protein
MSPERGQTITGNNHHLVLCRHAGDSALSLLHLGAKVVKQVLIAETEDARLDKLRIEYLAPGGIGERRVDAGDALVVLLLGPLEVLEVRRDLEVERSLLRVHIRVLVVGEEACDVKEM